jgi:alkanesulfonate monooxygenase SsuD/methylene tetrahydromethanopterin reductase-like flavin-dependent oxidoreductase (luciferase family)
VKVGVTLPIGQADALGGIAGWPRIHAYAQHAEAVGLDSIWLADHLLFRFPDEPTTGIHEAWTILSALAATTTRVEVGTLVLCLEFRNPALVAKMAVTADEVSGGRLVLGLGAGWHDPEYEAFGIPLDHRVGRFEEGLRIVAPLLRGESVTIDGRWHHARDAILTPPPGRRVPILVAAKGPRMLRLTARHADAWNTAWYGRPDERLAAALAGLDRALDLEHRDPGEVARTVGVVIRDRDQPQPAEGRPMAFEGRVDAIARLLDEYAALSVDELTVWLEPKTERSLDRLAEAVRLQRGVVAR